MKKKEGNSLKPGLYKVFWKSAFRLVVIFTALLCVINIGDL